MVLPNDEWQHSGPFQFITYKTNLTVSRNMFVYILSYGIFKFLMVWFFSPLWLLQCLGPVVVVACQTVARLPWAGGAERWGGFSSRSLHKRQYAYRRETAILSGHIIAAHPITCTEVESKTGRYKDGRQTKNPISGIFLALLPAAKYRNN